MSNWGTKTMKALLLAALTLTLPAFGQQKFKEN
jgi:hypothetical protein